MSSTRNMRKSALSVAMGLCLAALATGPVMAQGATGGVAGRATAGDEIVLVNKATGATRTVVVGGDGTYRVGQLPIGDYALQLRRGGQSVGNEIVVNVAVGGTTTVNLGSSGDVTNLGSVQVIGSRIINRVDVQSTETSTVLSRAEISRMPVDQSLGSVALLAPGVIGGNSGFGGISFGGSSVAENSVFINGLNVTDFYQRQSFSTAPFAFFQEFQVKTGGYSVEFGRSTGGVINAVTRSGSNEFKGGVEMTFEPAAFHARADDHVFTGQDSDGTPPVTATYRSNHDRSSFMKANAWASGPIIKDRVFLFAMYEQRDSASRYTNGSGSTWSSNKGDNGFWGAKLDWNITDNHLLELLAFSDAGDSATDAYAYNYATSAVGAFTGNSAGESGGKNGSVTWTGHFGQNFTAKAMYGVNRSRSLTASPADGSCAQVLIDSSYNAQWTAMGRPAVSCHPSASTSVIRHFDERRAARLDFEWTLGNHLLRFGMDRELMTTDRTTRYPGTTGMRYTVYSTTPGSPLDNGATVPAGVNAIVMGRRRIDGGVFDTSANAWYIEDIWNITPNLVLNLGVRVDGFNNKTAAGDSFIKMDNLVSPRFGFSWDMKGDGSSKLFGNLGRYYLPVTNIINYNFAGGLTDERTFYALGGWKNSVNPITGSPYSEPMLGAQIGPVDDSYNLPVDDLRQSVSRDLDAVYQDEAILGFQQALGPAWSWGVNATYRRMPNAMDDIRINHTPCGPVGYNLWPIGNPGGKVTIWGDADIGCATEGWITIDTSKDGYRKGGSGEVVGYSTPRRTYKALEFQIDRAWDDRWAFNASYLWSRSEGNHEGPVNSDTNYNDTGMVQHWDHPANNQDYGPLFNDHRHQIKLRGAFKLNDMWSFGATFTALSGGPITPLGVAWPGDSTGAGSFVTEGSGGGSFWHCVQNCSGAWNTRVFEYAGRGSGGRLPWIYNLGANVTWTMPVPDVDLKVRLSVFNLLNEQETINIRARYEKGPGVKRGLFGTGTRWQSPRYAQLVVTYNF